MHTANVHPWDHQKVVCRSWADVHNAYHFIVLRGDTNVTLPTGSPFQHHEGKTERAARRKGECKAFKLGLGYKLPHRHTP